MLQHFLAILGQSLGWYPLGNLVKGTSLESMLDANSTVVLPMWKAFLYGTDPGNSDPGSYLTIYLHLGLKCYPSLCFRVCMYFDAHAEVRGYLCAIWPLLPSLCRFWGLNSGRQTCTANTFTCWTILLTLCLFLTDFYFWGSIWLQKSLQKNFNVLFTQCRIISHLTSMLIVLDTHDLVTSYIWQPPVALSAQGCTS